MRSPLMDLVLHHFHITFITWISIFAPIKDILPSHFRKNRWFRSSWSPLKLSLLEFPEEWGDPERWGCVDTKDSHVRIPQIQAVPFADRFGRVNGWIRQVGPTKTLHPYCWWFRNPVNSPVEVGSFSHYWQGFSTIPGGAGISSINSPHAMKEATNSQHINKKSSQFHQIPTHTITKSASQVHTHTHTGYVNITIIGLWPVLTAKAQWYWRRAAPKGPQKSHRLYIVSILIYLTKNWHGNGTSTIWRCMDPIENGDFPLPC